LTDGLTDGTTVGKVVDFKVGATEGAKVVGFPVCSEGLVLSSDGVAVGDFDVVTTVGVFVRGITGVGIALG
jgi:hypothetical protein